MPDTWVSPRVWIGGERVTATKMNELSTDFRVLYPYTTGGDTVYRDPAGDYLTRLAKGSAYQSYRMKSDATIPEWGGYVCGKVTRSTNQSINTNSNTNIQFTGYEINQGGVATWTSGDNTKLTVGVAGLYAVFASYTIEGGVGYRESFILVNGSNRISLRQATANGETTYITFSGLLVLSATNYIQLMVFHNHGSALNVSAASLSAVLLGV